MTASSDSHAALELLAQQASALTLAGIPAAVLQQARLCVLDTLGCILAGTATDEARLALACEPATAGDSTLGVYGTAQRRSLVSALRIHGYLGDVLELNDLIGGHASIGNVTAALGLAQATGATQGALLEAVVRGIEVTSRIYQAVYPSLKRFSDCGLVPVGIPSSIGAATAAAHLHGLDEHRTAHAMAIAGALAGWCPAEVIFGDGGSVKPMLFGAQPAVAGVTAAAYAAQGMTGPLRLLESGLGYFNTVSNAPVLYTGSWGDDNWALARPRRKLHACCGYLHCAVDAASALRESAGVGVGTLIDVHVPPYTADAVAKLRAPLSPNDARFHLQYCLALVLCGADVIEPDHSIRFRHHLARDELRQAMARIRVVPDASLTHYERCRLVARDEQGRALAEVQLDAPRGAPARPLPDADVIDKFERLAAPVLGTGVARETVSALMAARPQDPVCGWLDRLSGKAG